MHPSNKRRVRQAPMRFSHDLDTLLGQAMLDSRAVVHLLEKTKGNLMPFADAWKNMALAAIRQLHGRGIQPDIITVGEVLTKLAGHDHYAEMLHAIHAVFDPIAGKSVCLRPFHGGDVSAFVAAVRESVQTVGTWLPWCRADYSETMAVIWFSRCKEARLSKTAYELGIFSPDGSTLYGGVAINHVDCDHRMGNVGYWVRQSCQRRGFASEAVRLITEFGFRTLCLTRLEIVVAPTNVASRALAERVGAAFEGIVRNRLVIADKPHHAAVYSLVPASSEGNG